MIRAHGSATVKFDVELESKRSVLKIEEDLDDTNDSEIDEEYKPKVKKTDQYRKRIKYFSITRKAFNSTCVCVF